MFFHGGAPNLKRILPPSITGAPSCSQYGAGSVCRIDRVYVTTDFRQALIFSALHQSKKGCVYEVIPKGDLTADPDYLGPHGESIECESAEIVSVIRIKPKDRIKIRKIILNGE